MRGQRLAMPGMPRVAQAPQKGFHLIHQPGKLQGIQAGILLQAQRELLALGHELKEQIPVLAQFQRRWIVVVDELALFHPLKFCAGGAPFLKLKTPFGQWIGGMGQSGRGRADLLAGNP